MRRSAEKLEMGAIYCKHCLSFVGTQNTNRVAVYYGVCDRADCRRLHREAGMDLVHAAAIEMNHHES